jgi:Domain of unknown function (DUF4173)
MPSLRHPNALLLIALALGLCANLLFYERMPGLSVPLFVGLGLAAMLRLSYAEGRRPSATGLGLGAAALGFATLSMLRDAPLLVALNLLATIGLLLVMLVSYQSAALWRLPGWQLLGRLAWAVGEVSLRPVPVALRQASQLPLGPRGLRALAPVGRGLLLAAPVLLVFSGLLMLADEVFASYMAQLFSFQLPFEIDALIPQAIVIALFAWASAGGMLAALHSRPADDLPAEGETQRLSMAISLRFLGWGEALTVLVAVNLLFASFMLVQGAYFFGGLDGLARTGLSYAEYARRGFFELLAVACLSLAMLWLLATVTRRELPGQGRLFNLASAAMVALVLGILASAFQRMSLYEQAYGLTQLRIYTHTCMVWMALVLLLFVVALVTDRPRLFSLGGCASALAYLAILSLANPDAIIVRANIERYLADPSSLSTAQPEYWDDREARETVDLSYLTQLSSDATPALVAALPLLDGERQALLRDALALRRAELEQISAEDGLPSFHLARAQALSALQADNR